MEMSSSFRMASQFPFVVLVFLKLLIILDVSNAETGNETGPVISNSVANHICNQQNSYQETSQIQPPLKSRPQNDDSECGWFQWTKCGETESETCPSFVLEGCDQVEKSKKKGKGITSSKKKLNPRTEADPCDNSTEQGLVNPEVVSSASKYPSVVTIEIGDRCQIKYCTGVILNEYWVVVQQTGCFYHFIPEHSDYFVVVAGERRMYVEEGTEQRRNVAEYIPHPGLVVEDFHYYKNNLGLVRISSPFEFNENVQPVDLSAIQAIAPSISNSTLKIVGWFNLQPKEEDQVLLASFIETRLDFIPMDKCYDEKMEEDEAPRETLLCAGNCIVKGPKQNWPMRSIVFAQEKKNSGAESESESESQSVPVPVGLGPIRRADGWTSQYGVFMNLAAYIPWMKETMEGQGGTTEKAELNLESESRIVRGDDAPPNKYKSMVNLEYYVSYACTKHSCGGSILNEEWILTAAHCLDNWPKLKYIIIAGDHDVSVNDENEQVVSISKVILHENYDAEKTENDIAVVKVTPPFKLNDKVQKVILPNPSLEPTGPVTSIGWGQNENYFQPHILQQVELPLVPLAECQKYYDDDEDQPSHPDERNICAGNETHASCIGDSGGPLYVFDASGQEIIVGIVSYGVGITCSLSIKKVVDPDARFANPEDRTEPEDPDLKFMPSVYTKVTKFLGWIRKNAKMDT